MKKNNLLDCEIPYRQKLKTQFKENSLATKENQEEEPTQKINTQGNFKQRSRSLRDYLGPIFRLLTNQNEKKNN